MNRPPEDTTLFGDTSREDRPPAEKVSGLTILYHPDLRWVGARAWFAGTPPDDGAWRLARHQLDFTSADEALHGPLALRKISRSPIDFRPGPDGIIEVVNESDSVKLESAGRRLPARVQFRRDDLARGVVLVVNRSVTLLLHHPTRVSPVNAAMPALLGQGAGMAALRQQILAVAGHDIPVLLCGESGTGKELVASALHAHSGRAAHPMRSINMAAIPRELAVSELFGHAAGAFSGARDARDGMFVAAHRGTLFLDEIGDAPMPVQVALLRALETGLVTPLGQSRAVATDVRVIAATDRDLVHAIAAGRFHGALLERLGGIQLEMPPLRARREDVPILLLHFLREFLTPERHASLLDDPDRPWLSARLMAALVSHQWPRNVRQLRNVAREMALLSSSQPFQPGPKVRVILVGGDADGAAAPDMSLAIGRARGSEPGARSTTRSLTREQIREALRAHRYGIQRTAGSLGISPQSLYRLLDQHDILYAGKITREMLEACAQETGGDIREMARRLEVSERALRLRKKTLDM